MPTGTFSDVKALHVRGHISIARDKTCSRNEFITCGTDGTVYLWNQKCLTDNTSPEIVNIGESTNSCVAWRGENVYVGYTTTDLLTGVDKRVVGKASINSLSTLNQVLIFSLEPTAIDVGEKYIVAGGSDFSVKVIKVGKDEGYSRLELAGEVLSIALSPNEQYFAVSATDGTVSVYDVSDLSKSLFSEKMFTPFGTIDIECPRAILAWSKSGNEIFVPSSGVVKVIDTTSWTINSNNFKGKGIEIDGFSTLRLSQCGTYLASATITNHLFIWRISDRELVSQNQYKRISQGKNIVTDLEFSPWDPRNVILVDANEGLSLWKNALPSSLGEISGGVQPASPNSMNRPEGDNDDEEDDMPIKRKKNRLIVDEAEDDIVEINDDDDDTRMSGDIGAIKRQYGLTDEGTGRLEDYGFGPMSPSAPELERPAPEPTTLTKIVEYEPPAIPAHFVSGSTPSHHTQRYLKWNSYGVVRSFTAEENNSIEVEFHDASIHSEIILDNSSTNYCLADLCDYAVVLASSPEGKNAQSDVLVFHINSWDPESRRWQTKLPVRDLAIDVLVSRDIIAIVTSQRNIRIFTLAGTQRQIICHPAPILTCALYGSLLSIASVNGAEFYEEFNGTRKSKPHYQYSVSTYNMTVRGWPSLENSVSSLNLAVTPGKRPLWLSFTNKGQLVTMDSDYIVRLRAPAGYWVPIFDGSKEVSDKSDGIWPIAIVDNVSRQFRYLYCKSSRHPPVASKQAPLISPWNLPYCQLESEKSKLEESLFLNELQQNIANEAGLDNISDLNTSHLQSLVKLFALACKAERETRASELALLVSSSKGIQAMCNYASSLKKHVLSEKVAAVGREKLSDNTTFEKKVPTGITPRRISMKKRVSEVVKQSEIIPDTYDVFEEKEDDSQQVSQLNDSVMSESTQIPIQPFNRNPFKRSADTTLDTSSLSVFDQLESSFDNPKKRSREDENQQASVPSAKRQMKLSFGAAVCSGKENQRVTPYGLWLQDNETKIKSTFSGEAEEFERFCMGQFRLLDAAQKKDYKSKAEEMNKA